MNPQTQMPQNNLGKNFIEKVIPRLNEEEMNGFIDYTKQVGNVASKMSGAAQIDNRKRMTAQRKQNTVNTLFNGGQMQGAQE